MSPSGGAEASQRQDCVENAERYILRAAAAANAGVPDEEIRERLEAEGCAPEQVAILIAAGRQLAQQRERDWEREDAGGASEDCHVCQPFTKLVRDQSKFQACMKRAEAIGEISTARQVYDLVKDDLEREDQEVFEVLCLDFRGNVRDYVEVGRGQRHRVAVDVEDILRPIIASGCDGAILLHGHPSGVAEPSDADGELTNAVRKAMEIACPTTHLLDHVVIGSKQFFSFAESNWKVTSKVTLVP